MDRTEWERNGDRERDIQCLDCRELGFNPHFFSKALCWIITHTVCDAPPPHDGPKVSTPVIFGQFKHWGYIRAGVIEEERKMSERETEM
jgi:hypothetical protein